MQLVSACCKTSWRWECDVVETVTSCMAGALLPIPHTIRARHDSGQGSTQDGDQNSAYRETTRVREQDAPRHPAADAGLQGPPRPQHSPAVPVTAPAACAASPALPGPGLLRQTAAGTGAPR